MSIMDGQINISMNARGVDSEIARLQKTIDNFGSRVSGTGKKTSDGVNQIGKGVKEAAYQVDGATTRMAQSILKQTVALESGGRQAAEYYRQIAQLNNLDSSFLNGYIQRLELAEKKNKSFADSINAVRIGIAGASAFIAGSGLLQLAKYSDSYTRITAQILNASSGQIEYNQNLAATIRIAQLTQAPLESVAKLNSSLTRSLSDQAVEQSKINLITQNVALALKAQGTEASQTGAVITQLSQAFASGVLRGDEFNSMAENAPLLQKALADSLGVTVGELRAMAENGELTADKLVKAFGDGKLTEALQKQAANMTTLSGAWQNLTNAILTKIGQIDKAVGASSFFSNALGGIAGTINPDFAPSGSLIDSRNKLSQMIWGNLLPGVFGSEQTMPAANKPAKVTLSTKADIDKKWQDGFLKDYQDEVQKRNKVAQESAQNLAELQSEIAVEFYQEERERIEKLDKIKRDLFVDTVQEEDKRLDDKAKKAEKFAEYQRKLEEDLNSTALKFIEMQEDAQQKSIERNAAEAQRQYERTQDILTREILSSLNRGFGKDGLSIAENFFETLKNMAQSVVLEPAIRFVLNQTGITGLANSIGSIFNSTPSVNTLVPTQNSSIIDRITESFKSINTTFSSSIEKLGVFLSNGQGGLADKIGGFLGQYSSQIADGFGYLGAAYMLSQGNVVGAGLTAAGTYFGGPIGGAIGSAIGSLFGKKQRTPRYSAGVSTSFQDGEFASTDLYRLAGFKKDAGGREGLSAAAKVFSETLNGLFGAFDINSSINTQLQFFKRKGAWGSASIMVDGVAAAGVGGGSTSSVYSKDAQTAFNNLISEFLSTGIVNAIKVSKLPEGIKGLFDYLTDQTQIGNMINASVSLASAQDALSSTYNLNADLAGKVATASGLAGDSLIAFVNSLTAASLSQQSAASVLLKERAALTDLTGAVPTTLKAFDNWLKSINTTTAEGQTKFAEMFGARDRVTSLTSAFDSITTARDNALFGLLSQSEQMAISQEKLRDAFAEVNAEVPGSRDELVKWVNGLDLTTEAGLKAAMAVPALVDAFQQIEENANTTTNALRDMSRFTNLADYRFYKGVANNYGSQMANEYAGVNRLLGANSQGQTTLNGESVGDLKQLLAELRDTTKQALATQRETASALQQIQARGLKTV